MLFTIKNLILVDLKNSIYILFLILFNSCKTNHVESKQFNLSQIYQRALKSNIIDENPIILIDNKYIGLISEIDTTQAKYKNLYKTNLSLIAKNNNGLIEYFGINSKQGIIVIHENISNGHNFNYPLIFILNNQKLTLEELPKDKKNKYFIIGYFEGIKDNKNECLDLWILNKNKKEVGEILKIFK